MNNLIVAGRAVGLASHFFIWLLGACLLAIVIGRRAGGEDSPMAMAGREVGLVTFILCGLLCILHMVLLTLGLVAEPRKMEGENGQLLVDVGISGIGALLVFIISPTLALRLYNY
ncbi:uncharacterized protein LOC106866301 isoform X2 [Brachypodium distachyon]|uniref:uncharacterized protein LOC106866301 isoform X2 n=1 Tax=Brachypodium distachyon TaxID=15368 RepID=UPI000D0DF2E9|nr:uncharacterized protein LOC106866301 isoform X2 [Brachypodium distachyon]|eukprot:XP_024318197.1 uncharacterized protein LOC106866301 isoform X2 [Brachypodium distachyon]